MNTLTLYMLGLVVYIIGGASEGAFQNKTATLGVLDEADFHVTPQPGKPNNLDDLRSRLKAVTDAKIYALSKPKTEAHLTYQEYKTGTRHKCHVPCPHCGHYQELVWENMRYDHCKDLAGEHDLERVKRETRYECEVCHKEIDEKSKREMLLAHRWIQTNPRPQPSKLSAHVSDLYSQFPTASWGVLACEYLAGLKSMAKMTTFRTDRLGLPSRLQSSERSNEDILKLRCVTPRYHIRSIPIQPALMAIGADVQGDVKKWVKGGFDLNGQLHLVSWGYTLAFDDLLDEAAELVPVGMPYDWPRGRPWEGDTCIVEQGIIDEGHMHLEVRRFCQRSGGLFVPSKGRGGIQVRRTVVESLGECDGEEIITYHFDDDAFKKQLYIDRISHLNKIISGKTKTPRMFLPWEIDAEFADELCSEKLTVEPDRMGFPREVWKKNPSIPNDFGDALKQLLVIWYWLGPQIQAEAAERGEYPETTANAA